MKLKPFLLGGSVVAALLIVVFFVLAISVFSSHSRPRPMNRIEGMTLQEQLQLQVEVNRKLREQGGRKKTLNDQTRSSD